MTRHPQRPVRTRGLLPRSAIAALAVAALAGCGISAESSPRDIELADDVSSDGGQAAVGEGRVFLVVQEGGGVPARLVPVTRDVDAEARRGDPSSVLASLIAGPNATERTRGITTLLPAGVTLIDVSTRPGGVVVVDLDETFGDLTGQRLVLALAQLVHTVSEVGGVDGVRITVAGESRSWPDVNGRQQSDALTVWDYAGLVRSTQPAFPAVPSG